MAQIPIDLVVLDKKTGDGWVSEDNYANEVVMTRSGSRYVASRWDKSMRGYKIPYKTMDRTQKLALRAFFRLRRGNGRGFLLVDIDDVYACHQLIGTGDGSTTDFQLKTTLSDGVAPDVVWTCKYPMATGTVIPPNVAGGIPGTPSTASINVYLDDILKTEGSDYTLDHTTGIVSFAGAPSNGVEIRADWMYYIPVALASGKFSVQQSSIYGALDADLIEVLF